MALEFRVEVRDDPRGFVRASAPVNASFRWMLGALDTLARATARRTHLRVLLDLSAVQPPALVEQSILGEHVARQLGHAERVASLVAMGSKTGHSQRIAQALGLQLRVFTLEDEAIQWLLGVDG